MDARVLDRLPGAVFAELDRRGIDRTDLAATVEVLPDDALLVTGSYATGEHNPTSDLDLLVLTHGHARHRPPSATNHPSTFGDSFDVTLASLTVNVEYVAVARVLEVCALVAAVNSPNGQVDLPNLQPLEVRLVQRVATGIALYGDDLVNRLRPRLNVEHVRASVAALNFVMAMSLLEDTVVLSPPARELMCRSAAEALLLSAVNAHGQITYDIKHLCSRAARVAERPGTPVVCSEREQVLFADRLPVARAREWLLDLAVDLYRSFDHEECPALVRPMLRPFREQWEWAHRDFRSLVA